jgi:hypothetical protein
MDRRIWRAALAPLALESAHGPADGHRAARTTPAGVGKVILIMAGETATRR